MKRTDIKRRPLADTTLSSLEPEAGAYRELDSPGLYFRVKPNGQKSWELRYKKPDGKWSWLGLGGYPEVGGAFARQKAADLRADASEGKNPITSKKARQAAEVDAANDTFEALAREWHMSRLNSWDAGTAKRILGALERHVFPSLGKRPYTSIMSMEWMELLRGLERQGILEQMSRVRAYCKDIYDLARVTGRAVNNPLEGVHKFLSSGKAENYAHVSPDELPGFPRLSRKHLTSKAIYFQACSTGFEYSHVALNLHHWRLLGHVTRMSYDKLFRGALHADSTADHSRNTASVFLPAATF